MFTGGREMETVTLSIRISKEQKERLQEQADKEKRSLSNYIKLKLGLL